MTIFAGRWWWRPRPAPVSATRTVLPVQGWNPPMRALPVLPPLPQEYATAAVGADVGADELRVQAWLLVRIGGVG
ncbi:hypothetical protein [Streptomyces lydicamycinicus]|uniref:hypothetical protein n=1 Tax=Streptomyces lydicamycinicus TaxID=1546107 RepID=UPI003C2D74E5